MQFKHWLQKDEGIKDFAKYAALGIAGASLGIPYTKHRMNHVMDDKKHELVNYINSTYSVKIKPEQIEFEKPWDVIKQVYGNQADKVLDKAVKNQKSGANKKIVFDKMKLMNAVPVVSSNPSKYGYGKSTLGFCSLDNNNNPFCVVMLPDSKEHELFHATQELKPSEPLVFTDQELSSMNIPQDDKKFIRYLLLPQEFGVRVAKFKRDYYKLTGKIPETKDEIALAISNLVNHKYRYSDDSRDLAFLIANTTSLPDAVHRLTKLIEDIFPKTVDISRKNINNV